MPQIEQALIDNPESRAWTAKDAASLAARKAMPLDEAAKLCGCSIDEAEKWLRLRNYPDYTPTPSEIRDMCAIIRDFDELQRWDDVPEAQRQYYRYGSN